MRYRKKIITFFLLYFPLFFRGLFVSFHFILLRSLKCTMLNLMDTYYILTKHLKSAKEKLNL